MSTAVPSARRVERISSVDARGHRDRFALSSPTQPTVDILPPQNSPTVQPPTSGDIIDMETFQQILELDEGDGCEFSLGMAVAYFSQAHTTFAEMDEALRAKDLAKLSSLGHFLKGSSAALGVSKVQASCERMQHYGQKRDEQVGVDLTNEEALAKIAPLLTQVKSEYGDAEAWLKAYYDISSDGSPTGREDK